MENSIYFFFKSYIYSIPLQPTICPFLPYIMPYLVTSDILDFPLPQLQLPPPGCLGVVVVVGVLDVVWVQVVVWAQVVVGAQVVV